MALPMPAVEPVTSAIFFVSFRSMVTTSRATDGQSIIRREMDRLFGPRRHLCYCVAMLLYVVKSAAQHPK